MKNKNEILLLVGGILVLLLTAAAYYKEIFSEWRSYQNEFLVLAEKKLGAEQVQHIETGFHQIWVPSLKVVDRCKTCHMAIDIPGFETEKQPFKTHSNLSTINSQHPFKDFGCTPCHGGQGYATRTDDAHGEVKHWEEPMLSSKLAKKYNLPNSAALMEVNCNSCHRHDEKTVGTDDVNLGKQLVKSKGCVACHVIEGKGASVGPEITYEGDKHSEGFIFTGVKGTQSVLNWHFEHFKNPQTVSPGSKMTNYYLTDREAMALSILMMSWRRKSLPIEYVYDPDRHQSKPVTPTAESGKSLFATRGCVACHTLGQGKRVGPDLKGVSKRRSAEWLTKFMAKPSEMLANDPTAKKLLKEFSNVPMPDPGLADSDVKSLLLFFQAYDKGKITP